MKPANLTSLSDEALVDMFVSVATSPQKKSLSAAANALAEQLTEIREELTRRGEASLRKLCPLLDHADPWARYSAAVACLHIDRPRCIAILRAFAEGRDRALAGNAFVFLIMEDPEFDAEFRARMEAKHGTDHRNEDP